MNEMGWSCALKRTRVPSNTMGLEKPERIRATRKSEVVISDTTYIGTSVRDRAVCVPEPSHHLQIFFLYFMQVV